MTTPAEICEQQLERGASFSLITECEDFTVMYDAGGDVALAPALTVGFLLGSLITLLIIGMALRS